jgi:hypothetical protein
MTRANRFVPRTIAIFAFLALLTGVTRPAHADTLIYSNGSVKGTIDSDNIATSGVSDSFTVTGNFTLTLATIGLWMKPGDTPSGVDWSIGTSAFSSNVGSGTSSFLGEVEVGENAYGYEIWQVSFDISGTVAPGTDWLSLSGATSSLGEGVNWDLTDGPSLADIFSEGTLYTGDYSESFQIYGNSSSMPEPSSLSLLGVTLPLIFAYRIRKENLHA